MGVKCLQQLWLHEVHSTTELVDLHPIVVVTSHASTRLIHLFICEIDAALQL